MYGTPTRALLAHDLARLRQVRTGHAREEVVLDLVVEAAHEPRRRPSRREMLREVRTCLVKKSSFAALSMIGMPLWFGANDAPMYSPNTASCTPRNANAMPSGSSQKSAPR